MKTLIGNISLNISLILYLINYIPQLIHNYRGVHLSKLSIYYHAILYFSVITDLFYGFSMQLPWQYKLVSITFFFYLWIQHWQMRNTPLFQKITFMLLSVFFICLYMTIFLYQDKTILVNLGYASQGAGIIYALPQVIKNIKSSAALSLSVTYLFFSFFSRFCDNISAYCLSWPLPSKLGALCSAAIFILLLCQWRIANLSRQRYRHIRNTRL